MLLCESKCYARIGETLEQCEKRYGKRITEKEKLRNYAEWMHGVFLSRNVRPKLFGDLVSDKIKENGEVAVRDDVYYFFRLEEYVICVKLNSDKVDAIRFMKSYKWDDKPTRIKLSSEEKDAFIGANTGEVKCVNFMFSFVTDVLVIHTEEYNNKLEKQKELRNKEEDDKAKNVLKKF